MEEKDLLYTHVGRENEVRSEKPYTYWNIRCYLMKNYNLIKNIMSFEISINSSNNKWFLNHCNASYAYNIHHYYLRDCSASSDTKCIYLMPVVSFLFLRTMPAVSIITSKCFLINRNISCGYKPPLLSSTLL
jgi:hypothetical protein